MNRRIMSILLCLLLAVTVSAQEAEKQVYDEAINPMTQIDEAVSRAKANGKFVICQFGGNWCPWCIKFASFVNDNEKIRNVIDGNFEYIHVNYPHRAKDDAAKALVEQLTKRLNNAQRFGFPVLVVLNAEGQVIHIQDSSFLEEGDGYNEVKVLSFLNQWKPSVVK